MREQAELLSGVAQILALAVAFLIGRFILKKRNDIWVVAFLGAILAMVAHILVDGQGAFLLLMYAPVIYFASVVGRRRLT